MPVVCGCSSSDPWDRILLSGKVIFNETPVEKGQIRFVPIQGSRGPVTIAVIEQGRYSTRQSGGVPVGTHRVEITGYDPEEYAAAPKGPGDPPVRPLLPAKYNRQSELEITLDTTSSAILDFRLEP